MCLGVTHLHGARVGAQQERQAALITLLEIKCILHGTRRVVLGIIERRKVKPVCLDLRPICHLKTDRLKYLLYTPPCSDDWVDGAYPLAPPRKGHIDGLLRETQMKLRVGEAVSALLQRCLDLRFDTVDLHPGCLAIIRRHFGEQLQVLGEQACLAEETGLRILKRWRI